MNQKFLTSRINQCNEEYSQGTKKPKYDQEQTIYKDLRDRNALVTIYRDCWDEQLPIPPASNQIIESVSWLSNYQSQIIEKNEQQKLPEKQAIKNILTSINKKNFGLKLHSDSQSHVNQTLQFYLNEATEKQQEGVINNVLLLIQPLSPKQQHDEYKNQFVECAAHAVQLSKKLPSQLKETSKGNKAVIINLTGKESKQNLETFNSIMQKDDEYLYFSFYKAKNEQETKNKFQKYFELMKFSNCQQFIIPFLCKNGNIFDGNYLYSLFEMFLENKIQKFSNLNYIALSLEISEEMEYEHYGLHQLIQKLMELSNQRLIVHVNFAFNEITEEQHIKIKQSLNICYFSFLEKIKNKFQYLQYENKIILAELLNQTHILYRAINLDEWSENLPNQRGICILSNLKQFEIQDDKVENQKQIEQNSPYSIFYKKSSEKMLKIKPILNGYKITPKTFMKIDYEEELIIIFQNQYYEDQDQFIVYAYVDQDLYNIQDLQCQLQFQELKYDEKFKTVKELQNPTVFEKQSNIYFLYGTQKDHELVNMNCYLYSLKDESWKLIPRAKTEETSTKEIQILKRADQQKRTREVFSNKIKLTKFSEEDLAKLECRHNPTVCFDQSTSDVQPILFSGEYVKHPLILNMIECLDFKQDEYQSLLVDKSQMYKDHSIKPFPNQVILQSNFDNTYYYLLLPGNDNYREKKQNHPANQSIQNYVSVIKKTTSDCSIQRSKINYVGKCFEINAFNNRQHNIQYIGCQRNIFLWRVIFMEQINDEISLRTLADLDVFVYQTATEINKQQQQQSTQINEEISQKSQANLDVLGKATQMNKQQQEKNQKTHFETMPAETDIYSLFENYLYNRDQQQCKESTEMILEQIETKDQFYQSKLQIIQNDEQNGKKYKCKNYTLAFENYIGFHHPSSNLLIKQYIYQLEEPHKVEIFDFQEEITIPLDNLGNKNIKRTNIT